MCVYTFCPNEDNESFAYIVNNKFFTQKMSACILPKFCQKTKFKTNI